MQYQLKNWRIWVTVIGILEVLFLVLPVKAQLGDRPFFQNGYDQMQQEIQRLQTQQQQGNPEFPSQLLTVDDGKLHWQKFIFNDGGFSVWMPEGVQSERTYTLDTAVGKLPFELVATHPLSWQFIAAYSDNLNSSQLSNSEQLLSSIRDSLVKETQFQLIEDKAISFEQYPGKQLTLTNGNGIFTFRVYLTNQRIYILGTRKTQSRKTSEEVSNFFDSFRLLN